LGVALSIFGLLAVFAGITVLAQAKFALQDIDGILCLGFGFVLIGLGSVIGAINAGASKVMKRLEALEELPIQSTTASLQSPEQEKSKVGTLGPAG
jgi:hypothetical protein